VGAKNSPPVGRQKNGRCKIWEIKEDSHKNGGESQIEDRQREEECKGVAVTILQGVRA